MHFMIIPHQYREKLIHQSAKEELIQGRLIPKGYVSATNILAIASELTGKRKAWSNYIKAENTQEFLAALSEENNQPYEGNLEASYDATAQPRGLQPLIIIVNGGYPELQGTWVHLEVALHLSQWASPKFAVWANKTLRLVLQGDFVALTEEAKKAERAEAIAAYRQTLFGGLTNSEYTELVVECRNDHQALLR
jgi:KilA-N domain